jgi:hypothetical protein
MVNLKLYEAIFGMPGSPDSNHGVGGKIHRDPTLGTNQGGSSAIYQYTELGEDNYKDDEDDEDLMFDDDIVDLSSKNLDVLPRHRVDLGAPVDASYYAAPGVNAMEERATHTNMMMTGMVPKTIKQKGASLGRASHGGSIIRHGPGRKSGTDRGWSRSPDKMKGEKNINPVFSLIDMLDKDELSFIKFQNEENKIKKIINEILNF